MKIFVTGASGFIGQNLVRKLAKTNTVYATGRRQNPFSDIETVKYTSLDLADAKVEDLNSVMADANHAILLGSCQTVEAAKFTKTAFAVNVDGTKKVLNAIEKSDIKNIVLASSAGMVGRHFGAVNGNTSPDPLGAYYITKYQQSNLVQEFCAQQGINYTIFRLANVYGPGQLAGIVPAFIRNAMRGDDITINGHPKEARDFIYVSDVVELMARVIERPANKTLPLGTGKLTTFGELANIVKSNSKADSEIKRKGATQPVVRGDFADVGAMEKEFGTLSFVPLEDGLIKTRDWLASI